MLSAFPMEKEDILEVASIAVHFETHFPTASKALLDKCISLLVSTMHTSEDVASFAEQASKDSHLAPLVVKLLAGMGSCKKLLQEVKEEKIVDVTETEVAGKENLVPTKSKCQRNERTGTRQREKGRDLEHRLEECWRG